MTRAALTSPLYVSEFGSQRIAQRCATILFILCYTEILMQGLFRGRES